jgi:hypothetical protein
MVSFKSLAHILLLLLVAAGFVSTGCVRKVRVPEYLGVTQQPVSVGELVARVNAFKEINSLAVQADVYVRDYYSIDGATAREFPGTTGALRLQRPENIRLQVTFPLLSSNIADMSSDGSQFRLAIFFPKERRMFVHGSSLQAIHKVGPDRIKDSQDPRLREAGALANIRPQHITDAFIIKPIDPGTAVYFREEVLQREEDTRPGKKGKFVERTYYVLYVLDRSEGGQVFLRRKFWFDRTAEGTPLVRQQTFENGDGRQGSDVFYSDFFRKPNSNATWAKNIKIRRPNDGYDLSLELDPNSLQMNPELPSTTFVLENTEHLRELDLDQPEKAPSNSDLRGGARPAANQRRPH